MADDSNDKPDAPKKLVLSKKTLKRLTVRSGVRTGLPLTDACGTDGCATDTCGCPPEPSVGTVQGSTYPTGSCRA